MQDQKPTSLSPLFRILSEQRATLDAVEILGLCASGIDHQNSEGLDRILHAKRYLIGISSKLTQKFWQHFSETEAVATTVSPSGEIELLQ